jgi:hypothetical protein
MKGKDGQGSKNKGKEVKRREGRGEEKRKLLTKHDVGQTHDTEGKGRERKQKEGKGEGREREGRGERRLLTKHDVGQMTHDTPNRNPPNHGKNKIKNLNGILGN